MPAGIRALIAQLPGIEGIPPFTVGMPLRSIRETPTPAATISGVPAGSIAIGIGSSVPSGTSGNVVIGTSANVPSPHNNAIAIGPSAVAQRPDAIAIGRGADAGSFSDDSGPVAIGQGAIARAQVAGAAGASVAVGRSASATRGSIAIGHSATALQTGNNAIAIGRLATVGSSSSNNNAIAIGKDAKVGINVNADNSIAIGQGADAERPSSIAIGSGALAAGSGGANQIVIGPAARSDGANAISIGNSTGIAAGTDSAIVMGDQASVIGAGAHDRAIVFGYGARSTEADAASLSAFSLWLRQFTSTPTTLPATHVKMLDVEPNCHRAHGSILTLANTAIADIGRSLVFRPLGFLVVASREDNTAALFVVGGAGGTVVEVSDPSLIFSTVQGTAGSINVFYDSGAGVYRVENRRGGTRTLSILLLGTSAQ